MGGVKNVNNICNSLNSYNSELTVVTCTVETKEVYFIILQEDPKINLTDIPMVGDSEWPQQMASLLENIHEDDALHDILIKVTFL